MVHEQYQSDHSGALSVLEIVAQKNAEARQILHEVDVYLKSGIAALTSIGVIERRRCNVRPTNHPSGGIPRHLMPLIAAFGTFKISRMRREVLRPIHDHVEGTHLDRLISWAEESWVVFGTLVMVILPVLMLLLVCITTAVLLLVRDRARVAEEHAKIACVQCGTMIYSCAMACPSCRRPLDQPRAVGFLGQSLEYATTDLADHPLRLYEKRRCPLCAHLKSRQPHQSCAVCQTASPANARFAEAYLDHVAQRLPVVLGVSFAFSLVPFVGLIVGAVYYRMALVLPFSQYLPFGRRFLLGFGIRLLFLLLAILQLFPLLGGLIVPVMALISFSVYRNSFRAVVLMAQPAGVP